jgi:type IV secretion system protein VirD4
VTTPEAGRHPAPDPSVAAAVRRAAWAAGAGVYLGLGSAGWAWAGAEHSTLVLGPSRSGKTSSLVIPNVLAAPGAVVSTSTKPDVLRSTTPARRLAGWPLLYDPSGTVVPPPGVERVGWSPVASADRWEGALVMADAMVRATGAGDSASRSAGHEHWIERSAALLAPLLHAASLEGEPMSSVLRWVDRHEGDTPLRILGTHLGDASPATDVLAGILATDAREQSGIWSTASGVLGAYRSPAALASTEPPYLDADAFCSGPHTLYVCAPGRQQRLLAPLVVGMLSDVRDAAYRRAGQGLGTPPVLLALDEVANIAPVPDLPAMVTEGAGQGLLTLASLQDLSQARRRWGPEADAFPSLFGTTVVLGGIADLPTLEVLSAIGGQHEVASRTVGVASGADGRRLPSVTVSTVERRRLPVDAVARGVPGAAMALDSRNRIGWVRLTPAHAVSPWRELAASGRSLELPIGVTGGPGAPAVRDLALGREPGRGR